MTVHDILEIINNFGIQSKRKVLTCGATHVAVDKHVSIFAFSGEPHSNDDFEWLPNRTGGRTVLYCGETRDIHRNWKELVWELP